MKSVMLIAVSVVLLSAVAQAQDPEQSWDNLRTLQAGQKIQVVDQNLKSQEGTFVSFSEGAISFRVNQGEVAVPRADVLRVTSLERSKRARNALIGLGVGAVVGGAIGFAVIGPGGSDFADEILGAAIALGAAGGAALGVAVPSYQTIYRAERRQAQPAP